MLKPDVRTIEKRGLHYLLDARGRPRRYTPWLGGALAFLYDRIMERSIFPKKLGGDFDRHIAILSAMLEDVHGQRVLEIAAGTGSAARFLPNDNRYTGTDISPGLLRRAVAAFGQAGFQHPVFYVAGAEELPFEDNAFDACLCILALNFFPNAGRALCEMARVLAPGGRLAACVPVPERNTRQHVIRGTLHSADALEQLCRDAGLVFQPLPYDNGAVLYFQAARQT